MNIGFITSEYPLAIVTQNIGGIANFIKNLAEKLSEKNHKVFVFIHSQKKNKIVYENEVEIHLIKAIKQKGLTWWTNRKYFNKYVNNIAKKNKIDVLEAPDWTGFTAFMKFNCPLVIRLHGSDTYFCHLENRKVKWKNKFFEKNALLNADKIIGVSEFVAQKTKELFNLNSDIIVIHNTIDYDFFTPNHQNIKPKTLLYFGTIIRKKGVFEIAKMFNKLIKKESNATLTFLGNDSLDINTNKSTLALVYKILSKKAKNSFINKEAVLSTKLIQCIQESDVVLLPSFAEAFPLSWLEAMALEKKLVTSNIGWASELMITEKTGYVVNPKKTDDFVAKVLDLLNNDENAKRMAKNARLEIIKNFNIKQFLDKNINAYRSLIK